MQAAGSLLASILAVALICAPAQAAITSQLTFSEGTGQVQNETNLPEFTTTAEVAVPDTPLHGKAFVPNSETLTGPVSRRGGCFDTRPEGGDNLVLTDNGTVTVWVAPRVAEFDVVSIALSGLMNNYNSSGDNATVSINVLRRDAGYRMRVDVGAITPPAGPSPPIDGGLVQTGLLTPISERDDGWIQVNQKTAENEFVCSVQHHLCPCSTRTHLPHCPLANN
eukprot:m.429553 g.429553  ORF g.429553 m.429553 type:complete len:223 (+) comp20237_c0_seq8:100-768(+)